MDLHMEGRPSGFYISLSKRAAICQTKLPKVSDKERDRAMASESERVTIRIPPDKIQHLQQLVKQGDFDTISDAIRAAIDRFIDQKFAPDYIRKLTIELPKGNVVELQHLVKQGDSVSVEDAIRNAVREYVRRRVTRAIQKAER